MKKNNLVFIVCDEKDEGALALYESLSSDKVRLYVKQAQYDGQLGEFVLLQSNSSGAGYTYGTANPKPSDKIKVLDAERERLVLDGERVIGYACKGEYNSSSRNEIFLELGAEAVKTEYSYYYQVFPTDGTSTEYIRSTYTKFAEK